LECSEVLSFLEKRPLHTAYLAGLIRDNGVQNSLNRGTFYGYRNANGQLEGVALIGHAILMETESDLALQAFAETAEQCKSSHMVMCEEDRIDRFWGHYTEAGQEIRHASRHLLLELRWPTEGSQQTPGLRVATLEDIELLIPVHAQMAQAESGIDPRNTDASGFRSRYARRIEQGRTWVLTVDDRLIFKAEVVSETPETAYIEGVWVNPDVRGQGYGRRCMSLLAKLLLGRTKSICLFVNDDDEEAQRFYQQAGYHLRSVYDTIFLK
jgi:predicted GNAT family acetyltransferase